MELSQKIESARKKKGLTQEELAGMANVTVRTIQRIENGEGSPRAFTIKALAMALNIELEDLTATTDNKNLIPLPSSLQDVHDQKGERDFLKTLCLSCFSYLIIPLVHFFVPILLLKKSGNRHPKTIALGRAIIMQQVYWVVALCLVLMLTLAYNFLVTIYFDRAYLVNYLVPFFLMYFINALLIFKSLSRLKTAAPAFYNTVRA